MVAALVTHTGAAPVDVIGHSYGGATAVRLALQYPDLVRSQILIEPILTPLLREPDPDLFEEYRRLADEFIGHARARRRERAWEIFLDYRNGPGTWAGTSDDTRARFLGQTDQTADAFASNLANPTTLDDCRSIQIPTTIVCGEQTTAPDRRVTELLHAAIPASRYVTIPGAAHMSPLTHAEAAAETIRDHLDRCGAPKRAAWAEPWSTSIGGTLKASSYFRSSTRPPAG